MITPDQAKRIKQLNLVIVTAALDQQKAQKCQWEADVMEAHHRKNKATQELNDLLSSLSVEVV